MMGNQAHKYVTDGQRFDSQPGREPCLFSAVFYRCCGFRIIRRVHIRDLIYHWL